MGSYDVEGEDVTHRERYKGTAHVTPQGESYKVTFQFEGGKGSGVGILMGDLFAVLSNIDREHTLVLLKPDGTGGWSGKWAGAGDEQLSFEVWKRRR